MGGDALEPSWRDVHVSEVGARAGILLHRLDKWKNEELHGVLRSSGSGLLQLCS